MQRLSLQHSQPLGNFFGLQCGCTGRWEITCLQTIMLWLGLTAVTLIQFGEGNQINADQFTSTEGLPTCCDQFDCALMSATRLGCTALLQGTRLSQLPAGCILVIFIYKSKLLSACVILQQLSMCWQSVCIYKLDGDYLQTFASQSESDSNRFTSDHECFNCHSRQPEN